MANYLASRTSCKLDQNPIWFELDLDEGYPFSLYVDLSCGAEVSKNKALVQFEFFDKLFKPEAHGLVFSNNPSVGWYQYLDTDAGDARTILTFDFGQRFSGKLRVGLRSWWEDDDIYIKSFVALSNRPLWELKEKYSTSRDVERYKRIEWESLGDFLMADTLESGLHTIGVGGLLLDFWLVVRINAPLLCFFHGNAPRNECFKLPVISGWQVTEGLNASFFIPSDPSLLMDGNMELGWHAGTRQVPLQYIYEIIIEKICRKISPEKLIFWGGSGGGFASLFLSARFDDSYAFVWNPQTSILAYEEGPVLNYAKVCFDVVGLDEFGAVIDNYIVSDVSKIYLSSNNKVFYLQNKSDWHVEKHLVPFLHGLAINVNSEGCSEWVNNNLYVHLGELADGHEPPPKEVIKKVLSFLVESNVDEFDLNALLKNSCEC